MTTQEETKKKSGKFKDAAGKKRFFLFIGMAIFLIFLAYADNAGDLNMAGLKKFIPSANQMATSPAAQEILKTESGPADPVPPENKGFLEEPSSSLSEPEATKISTAAATDAIVIKKIGTILPIVTAQTLNTDGLDKLLDEGVVMYPQSAGFGKVGQSILLGHSAPANWPKIKNDTAFSRINELIAGDLIEIFYKDRTYRYSVTRSEVISKGGDFTGGPASGSTVVLMTCWPPGRDLQRIAVEAKFIGAE